MRRLLALVACLLFVAAACGGDDGNGDDVAARSTTSEADSASEEDDAAASSEDFSGKGSGDFCDKAREYDKKFEDIGQNSADAEEEWRELEKAIDDIAEDAPDEIEADVAVVRTNFKEVRALLEKYDYDFSKVPPDEAAAIESEEVEEANERVNSYMETVCKIDQDGDGDTDGDEPGSDSGEAEEDPAAEE